tara:strand:+ start:1155 stop:1679 length:525 start_codon:yes stop_codon:yes gene_type:complete
MYFDRFPKGSYILPGTKTFKLVSDLFRRVKIRDKIKNEASIYTEYFVTGGERPEHIAQKHFGNPELHWVVLITNNIADALYDWPMSFSAFEEYIADKYDNAEAIHHYEKVQSSGPQTSIDYSHLIECNSTDPGAQAVSNREYEQRIQDRKSRIKLLEPAYLPILIEEFERLMNE